MALGYSASNATTTFPSVWYTGRLATDPLGTMPQGEGSIINGTGSQTGSQRWGDYTSMNIDPVDDCTFWYVNEWVPVTSSVGWQLRIGAFRFPECGSPDFTVGATPATQDICAGTNALYDVTVGSIQGYVNPVTLSASGNPAGTTTNFSTNPVVPPGSSTLTVGNTAAASAGSYNIDVVGVSQSGTHTSTVGLNVFDAAATVSLSSPANGATGVALAPTFTWTGTGTSYTIEIATDAGFTNIVETATVGGTSYTSSGLAANTTHYWRVTADNVCGGNTSAAWSFTTVDLLCSSPNVAIPDNNPAGVTNDLIVGNSGSIDDLNVSVDMTHTWVGDVIFTLQHVDTGTTVTFYDRPGVPASTFGCSGDNVDASLDDEAATPVEDECGAGVPAIAGSFIPNNPLSAFDGEDLAGTWRITASDLAGGDTGTLNTWCIDAGTSGGGGTPDISVTPASLSSTQATNTVVVQQLTIENVGTADLDWMIDEAAPVAPAAPVSGGRSERLGTTAPSSDAKIAGGVMPHGRTDVIADGGFEAGTPNPFWNEASSNFGTPICDVVSCGQGGGTGPHAGTYWTWFGGITGVVETGSMDQNVVIPAGTATLSFYLEIPVADSTGSMNVDIDGNVLFTATEADTGTYATYAPVTLDVSAYADGGSHNVRFSSTTDAGAGPLNFFVDDVVLDVQEGGGSACDAPSDIAWLSVSPAAGTTISGTSTLVDVTFDSTGYAAGTYTGTLCVNSNDPDTPLVEVPVEMVVTDVVVNPAIVVTATVGLDPMTCATTSSLVVGQPNTDVYYCYTVENTGNITLSLHDIMDDVGTNLSGVAYDLAPGATADTVALGLTISETVTTDTTNTVVWTAYVATGASASASSTAAVTEAPTDVTLSSFGGDSATLLPLMVATLAALFVGLGLLLRRRSQTL
jgi:subtilisin-like proprotein convertase family protein